MTAAAAFAGLAAALAVAGAVGLHRPRRRLHGRAQSVRGCTCDPLAGGCACRAASAPAASPPERAALAGLLARVGRRAGGRLGRLGGDGRAAAASARLEAAGFDSDQAPQLAASRGAAALAGLALAALLAPSLPLRWTVLTALAGPGAGWLAPDVWLHRRARDRGHAIESELADVLDLLRVAAAAGLPLRRALSEVGRRHPGVLAAELGRAAGRLELGEPDDAVLASLERRCAAPGVPALTAALTRARRLGAPLGGTLAAQAEQARARRAQRCAEAAARASPKIQLVVALLLVPSVLLLVAAALFPTLVGD